ncbi:Disease resistance protein ADR1, putative [Ricinus communis]|uniref:Disease resistance protein ADR1, putative n=1 Tax=Ricinus communis TaxID=3988 RepID=B9S8L2_RICCO|nr:Disease resistance protein ADR1, putative [Ricinus communis]
MAADLVGGAVLGAILGELLEAVLRAKNRTFMFKSILKRMECTLETVTPIVKEIEELNKVLDRRNEEMGIIMKEIRKGKKLVLECSGMQWYYACWRTPKYAGKLIKLEKSLKLFFQIVMQAQRARDGKEALLEMKDLRMDLKRLGLNANNKRAHSVNGYSPPLVIPEPPTNPVGLKVPLEELKMELFNDGASIVVLSAPPGCGKTTLAKLLCHDEQVKEKFRDNIFFVIVSRKPTMEDIVQKLFQHKDYEMPWFQNDEHIVYHLEQFLKRLAPDPILLVLDDIWHDSESLLDKFKFQIPNYKILVTSRSAFPRFGSNSTYKLKPLNDKDATTLFRNSASLPEKLCDIDEDVVDKIVKGCKGIPLALKVVGRSLCGEPEEIWKRREMELSKGNTIFEYSDILNCLQSSLDALDSSIIIKECYMDLCAFPEDQRIPVTALIDTWAELYELDEDGVYAVANLYELSTRNLIDLVVTRKDRNGSYNQHFVIQHDLLRELAIRQNSFESFEQTKRLVLDTSAGDASNWWMGQKQPSIVCRLLSISTDEKFASIWCSIQAPEAEITCVLGENEEIKSSGPHKLQFLPYFNRKFPSSWCCIQFEEDQIGEDFNSFLWLHLYRVQESTEDNIGEAFSSTSAIKVSEALPNLVELNIDYCNDFTELPVGLCQLIQLKKFSVTNCHKLATLPKEIGKLINLEVVRLSSCIELLGLPNTIESLQKLSTLDISECSEIRKLPGQIGDLHNLRKLHMMGCSNDIELPPSLLNLEHLKEVICDEEIASLWEPFAEHLKKLKIKVHKEDINLNWLCN